MSVWKTIEIKDALTVQGGYAFPSRSYSESGAKLIRISNVGKGKIDSKNQAYVPLEKYYSSVDYQLFNDNILMGLTGDLGKVCQIKSVDLPAVLNQRVGRFIIKDGYDNNFFYYLLISHIVQTQLAILFTGGAQANISPRQIHKLKVEIPADKTEQIKIANIFRAIDIAITSTDQLISKHQRIKTGMLYDLLTRGIDKHGTLRSEETHQFKDSPLGRIPVEWDASTIQKSCLVRNQYRKPVSQDVRSGMMGEYRYFGPTGILDYLNEYMVEGKYVLLGEDGDHFLKYLYQEQTILVEGKFNVNNHAHILEGTKCCLTEWIHLFFSHRDITLYLTRQGAGRYKLNKNSLLNLGITIPPIKEQKEILKRFSSLKIKHQNDISQLSKLLSLKTGLMQDLLSGKVRLHEELLLSEGIE